MTRKHFQIIAYVIADNKNGNKIDAEDLIGDLCYEFVNINPQFDAHRFREAIKKVE